MKQTDGCGLCGIYPKWLRGRATPKMFLLIYGLLGMAQSMSFIYIVVTLTALEKRFKIPSRTTGLLLSGNEISHILSLVLIYYGASGHRPKWLATGVGLSAISCFIMALPHAIYGPGKDALALTQEYLDNSVMMMNTTSTNIQSDLSLCPGGTMEERCNTLDTSDSSTIPQLLIFFSQFVVGIGSTLYFGLGQVYLDDNSKKQDTPLLLGCTLSLRTVGPVVGFMLGFLCLSIYIDPTLRPIIGQDDPRWLGAWWLGWVFLGTILTVFSCLIALFPRELVQSETKEDKQEISEEPLRLNINFHTTVTNGKTCEVPKLVPVEEKYKPTLHELPATLKRVLSNKIILCNSMGATCSFLGIIPYVTYLAKYLEVQFASPTAGGTAITGTISLIGMVMGFLISGFLISKFKPAAPKLLIWNVMVALIYFCIVISFTYVGCDGPHIEGLDVETNSINFTTTCNTGCTCDDVKYAPVCHVASMTTYFSACHAGCTSIIDAKNYGNCSCVQHTPFHLSANHETTKIISLTNVTFDDDDFVKAGPCPVDCTKAFIIFSALSTLTHVLSSSGKIGNILVNYRCVDKKDKSIAQGITITILSIFALIPGPIIFGALIDSTCLIWETTCGSRGNCWYYDKVQFRNVINYAAAAFTLCSAILDGVLCYLIRDLDLYSDKDDRRLELVKDIIEATSERPRLESNRVSVNDEAPLESDERAKI